jgi:hypothetical protein
MSVEKENFFFVVGVAGFSLAVSFLFTLFQHAPLLVERRFRYHPALEGIVTSDGCQANYLSYALMMFFHQVCLFLPLLIIVFFALHLLSCFPSHRNHD